MYGIQSGTPVTHYYVNDGQWDNPALSPPTKPTGYQETDAGSLSRSGGLCPWTKGGITYTPVKKMKTVKVIVQFIRTPVKRYRWTRDSNGKATKVYYILYRKKPVWGTRSYSYFEVIRSVAKPQQLLMPNNLDSHLIYEKNESPINITIDGSSGPDKFTGTCTGSGLMRGTTTWPYRPFGRDMASFRSIPNAAVYYASLVKPEVTAKLYANAKRNYANLVNAIATANQTTSMVTSMLSSAISTARACKRLELRALALKAKGFTDDAKRLTKEMSSMWLQYVYGVSPLYDDIMSVAKEVASQNNAYVRYRASRKVQGQYYVSNTQADQTLLQWSAVVKQQVTMRATISIPDLARAHGGDTPLATVYELIPYSFILDWVYPLGSWLANRTAFSYGVVSYHQTELYNWKVQSAYQLNDTREGYTSYKVKGSPQAATIVGSRCIRSVSSYPPALPTPRFSLNGSLSVLRSINLLALFLQRY